MELQEMKEKQAELELELSRLKRDIIKEETKLRDNSFTEMKGKYLKAEKIENGLKDEISYLRIDGVMDYMGTPCLCGFKLLLEPHGAIYSYSKSRISLEYLEKIGCSIVEISEEQFYEGFDEIISIAKEYARNN